MTYERNDKLEYLDTEDGRMVVFDPDSGDTHFLDETGREILMLLEEPLKDTALLRQLAERYEGDEQTIAADLRVFLAELVQKRVLLERA